MSHDQSQQPTEKRLPEPPHRHPQYKTAYRVKNWHEYDQALRDRGDITLWGSPDAIDTWTPPVEELFVEACAGTLAALALSVFEQNERPCLS